MVMEVVQYYNALNADPTYDGHFEQLYTSAFASIMGGGHADAVATGTCALFVAVAALHLPKGSEVLVSPITDPGTLAAICLNGLRPRLIDCRAGSYNVDFEQFACRITSEVTAAIIVHAAGQPSEIGPIAKECELRGIKLIEDCSQAHGAKTAGRFVGTFGDLACFSTMYGKAHITGSSGGVIFTRDAELFDRVRAHGDRGDPLGRRRLKPRDPSEFLFPALNVHSNEFACAIGYASLQRLADTIQRRYSFLECLRAKLLEKSDRCRIYPFVRSDSPYFCPIMIDTRGLACDKVRFAEALRDEGISSIKPHYRLLVADWPFLRPYLADQFATENARRVLQVSFNLDFHENYGDVEAVDIANAIRSVEKRYM
jgi:dTDP-4-amino-4,6-dideoxygalactose transaminase